MNYIIITYVIYLVLSITATVLVGHTLHKNGRVFLIDCFDKNHELADSVNHLLVVGFYLVNIGFVAHFLDVRATIDTVQKVFEATAAKMGTVLLVLGAMHFFNIFLFQKFRRRAQLDTAPPPQPPLGQITPPRPTTQPPQTPKP